MGNLLIKKISEVREKKISLAYDFDKSEDVNSFLINGERMWLDKATRVGLVNSTQIAKAAGAESIILWHGDKSYNIPCDMMLQMLSVLELYAMECYNVTAKHIATLNTLEDLNRIYNYNYTKGYPKRLEFFVLKTCCISEDARRRDWASTVVKKIIKVSRIDLKYIKRQFSNDDLIAIMLNKDKFAEDSELFDRCKSGD